MASKEAIFVDNKINEVLAECFSERGPIKSLQEAKNLFAKKINNYVLYFNRVKTLELSYDEKLSKLVTAEMEPILQPMPSFETLALLYLNLITNTILDPKVTTISFTNMESVGNIPPRIYVLLSLMASISASRGYNDNILAVSLTGKSSTGKSKILHPFTCLSKVLSFDSAGVGRYGLDAAHKSFYFHDISFSHLTTKNEFPIVKNILRGERAAVKLNKVSVHVPPSYVYITSNEVLFTHFLSGCSGMIKQLPTAADNHVAKEHLEALKNRIIEVRFYKKGKVSPYCFDFDINLFQAKTGLAAALMIEMKKLPHPLQTGAVNLIPAAIQGIMSVSKELVQILSMSSPELEDVIQQYRHWYCNDVLSIPDITPMKYKDF